MTAFATVADLRKRLGRDFTGREQAFITELLEDASAFLRLTIGANIYPRETLTLTCYPVAGEVELGIPTIHEIVDVTRDGNSVDYQWRPPHLTVTGDDPVTVQLTHGLAQPPRILTALCCSLVSQQLTLVEAGLGLSVGGLSSVALDDFKVAFANAGEKTGLALPDHTTRMLQQRFKPNPVTVVRYG